MNDESIIILKAKEFREILRQELRANRPQEPDITRDKLNREQAAKLAGMSLPTFRKFIKNGIFREHGHGRKTWFFRSEIIEALRNEADKKKS
ncbi:helix-turn-helix domain-containing protein [Maribellus comscasis]|uniref:Helix-turn-helix domain-containing protein n=1 Tax=Maribellus comscasis TaxID=2681766 RepID=A0A6I6JSF8_9BACT|nr:helix-turn-helix domain-containing protein [Maribellus comscasis]QGY44169.1 helix-turn-helix domain-containing protein [Maribellus comscasis]